MNYDILEEKVNSPSLLLCFVKKIKLIIQADTMSSPTPAVLRSLSFYCLTATFQKSASMIVIDRSMLFGIPF